MTDLSNASPAQASAASPAMGTPASSSGTIQPTGEAGQSATSTENFIPHGMDLNTLPPAARAELERINKEMVRGFTAKTQKLAEDTKKYEGFDAFKQKAELYEQFAAQEDFVRQWNEHVHKQSGQNGQAGQNDPNAEMRAKLQEIESKMQQSELTQIVEAFSETQDEKGQLMNPDFDALNNVTLGKTQQGEEFSLLRACIELSEGNSPQEKLANGYKSAKMIRDQILEEGRKQGMGKMLSKVRNSTEAPSPITSDKQSFNGDAKKLSVREARELAEKGVLVH